MTVDVRERSREILRTELARAAADFCAEHGIDALTVDDLAHGIGISRATFFRYFGSKEDAVVVASRAETQPLADLVRGLAADPGASALATVRAALGSTIDATRADPERIRARIRMIGSTPGLRARLAVDRTQQRDQLEAALAERLPDAALATAAAYVAMAAIELAWNLWTADDDADMGTELDRAFALVASTVSLRLD